MDKGVSKETVVCTAVAEGHSVRALNHGSVRETEASL